MTKISTHLKRAAVGYLIAGIGFIAFGFPFWFLNAADIPPKGRFFPPFIFLIDTPLVSFADWLPLVSALGLLAGAVSFWQAGEPTGFGTRRRLLIVPMAGAVCYLLSTWILLPFAPMGAFLNGLGMILVGYASVKTTIWAGWKRYVPLIAGLFPFLFMFPVRFLTGARPAAIIGLWGFAWLLLSLAAQLRAQELSTVGGTENQLQPQ